MTDTPTSAPATLAGPIIVGVDGSENADRAMRVAASLAIASGADVVAVHALGLLATIDGVKYPASEHRDEIEAHLHSDWCATLEAAVPGRWRSRLVDGNSSDVLLHIAEEEGASFIVVGARGIGGHPDLMLGSTSHQVIHHSTVPTVVVPPIDRPVTRPAVIEPADSI
jgi:nucleotide-binding universal stress UspA family protein